ncbi:hypothetical protein ACL02T_27560 [Pseudonocardia sp. RS010]|uniref:hypothetical protein n=1 Tax=Pseudonocardia sp. RS010 TaxID=3385979 RepID=UPI0039A3C30B
MSVTDEVVDGVARTTIDRPEARNARSRDVREGPWEGPAAIRDERTPVWEGE